jgi:hypothetical protein
MGSGEVGLLLEETRATNFVFSLSCLSQDRLRGRKMMANYSLTLIQETLCMIQNFLYIKSSRYSLDLCIIETSIKIFLKTKKEKHIYIFYCINEHKLF